MHRTLNKVLVRLPTCHSKITTAKKCKYQYISVDSMEVSRSFLLRLFLQCRYRDFADNCLGGADNTTSGIVTLSSNPLDAADTETHGTGDCSGRCADEPGGKSPEISA